MARESCIKHPDGDLSLPLVRSFLELSGTHSGAAVLGVCLVRYLKANETPFSFEECAAETIGLYGRHSVRNAVSDLCGMGLLRRVVKSPEQIRDELLVFSTTPSSGTFCPWCKTQRKRFEAHHWPIAAVDGGTEVVGICSNCHKDYHAIAMAHWFIATVEAIALFRDCGITLKDLN